MKPIIDEKMLYKYMKSFYTITRCKVVIFDSDYNEVFAYPQHHCSFCRKMHEEYPGKCDESSEVFCKKSSSISGLYIGQCYGGLTEAVFPLIQDNITVGYIMFGQVRTIISPSSKSIPENALYCDKDCITSKSIDEIQACADILQALAHLITQKDLITPPPSEPAIKMKNYIENNLSEDLSIDTLCKKFTVNRNDIYSLTSPYMPGGIHQYITKLRLDKSKELLVATDMSVKAVAKAVGYDDFYYFSRCFKKEFGISTTEYRKSKKRKQPDEKE